MAIQTKEEALNASVRIQALAKAITVLTPREASHFIRGIGLDVKKDAHSVHSWATTVVKRPGNKNNG